METKEPRSKEDLIQEMKALVVTLEDKKANVDNELRNLRQAIKAMEGEAPKGRGSVPVTSERKIANFRQRVEGLTGQPFNKDWNIRDKILYILAEHTGPNGLLVFDILQKLLALDPDLRKSFDDIKDKEKRKDAIEKFKRDKISWNCTKMLSDGLIKGELVANKRIYSLKDMDDK